MHFTNSGRWKSTPGHLLLVVTPFIGLLVAARPVSAQLWNERYPSDNSGEYFQSVASSADGSTLVVVSSDSANTADSIGQIFVSTNYGVSWQTTSAPINWWTAVACSADGTKMVASAVNSFDPLAAGIYTSADSGATWQQQTFSVNAGGGPLTSAGTIASSADGTKWVLAGDVGLSLSSDSGATWQSPLTQNVVTNVIYGVASSADGTNLVAVGVGPTTGASYLGAIYHSSDAGATWAQFNLPPGFTNSLSSVASSADGRKLVAVGFGGIYTSADYGVTWQRQSGAPSAAVPPGGTLPGVLITVASSADGTRLVVGGQFSLKGIYTSLDSGVTWVSNSIPTPNPLPWFSVASSADGKKLAAVPMASGFGIYTVALDGLSESIAATPTRVDLQDRIQVTVTVANGTTNTLTNVQVDGSITTSGLGGVSFAGFSGPSVVLTLPPGTNATLTYEYTATNYGVVTFSATAVGRGPGGPVRSLQATSGTVGIFPTCDLMVKTTAKNDTNFLGVGEFQQAPLNDQSLRLAIGTNGVAGYVVRVQNDSRVAHTFVLRAETNPAYPNWNIQVLANSANILDALTGADGWTTPLLAPGATFDLQVSLSPMAGAGMLDNPYVRMGAFPDSTIIDYVLDAVQLSAKLVPVPIQISLYALNTAGLTPESIQAGLSDINAPLVPVTDPSILAAQPLIHGGLVADGVTPLLIQLTADPVNLAQFPQGVQFSIQPTTLGVGALNNALIGQRFQALQNGAWQTFTPSDSITLTATENVGYVELLPILSDDVLLGGQTNQVGVDFSVVESASGVQCGDIQFAIRKPPIALIHGYNTAGDWGDDFKAILGTSRPYTTDTNNNFILTVKYGQNQIPLPGLPELAGIPVYGNTVASLDSCAQLALRAFQESLSSLHNQWAFARFDVVAHSQGGVLTRMLCNITANKYISQPFRNPDNLNRGRFHRVVTIGSPHNGTRLLRYLLDLNQNGEFADYSSLPLIVGSLGVQSAVAQAKFDPWGPQIAEINDPSPTNAWLPDPGASFHLVRTVIDNGASPGLFDGTPSYLVLGLNTQIGGVAVIPRGSDGVVDFDSMAANVPPAPVGNNVFSVSSDNDISHSGPMPIFGSSSFQTESPVVAQHVIGALDQSLSLPAADIVFGSFSVPPLLSSTTKAVLDSYAALVTVQALANLIRLASPNDGQSLYEYAIPVSTNFPPEGNVAWLVQVYGPSGITSDGVELSVGGSNNSQVTVTVDNALVGDVVLSAAYQSVSNTVVLIAPTLVVSLNPVGASLTGFQTLPASIAMPVGTVISPQFLATYSDGSSSLRFVASNQVEVTSSQPSVVSVTNSLNWELSSVGTAQITVAWSGFHATSEIRVFDPAASTPPTLAFLNTGNNQLTLSWPGFTTSWQLESKDDLASTNAWQPVLTPPIEAGGMSLVPITTSNAQQFYRLQWQP